MSESIGEATVVRSVFAVLMCLAIAGTAASKTDPVVGEQIKGIIAKVRSEKTVDARTDAAEHLATLTQQLNGHEVAEPLVGEIAALLDSPDDSVRYSVATALGNIGPSARAAIPKLLEMLPTADCLNGPITSASGIRYALIQMGVKPPPPPTCERISF